MKELTLLQLKFLGKKGGKGRKRGQARVVRELFELF
jgi:hypothetical protein